MSHKKSSKGIKKRKNSIFFFRFCHLIPEHPIDLPSKKMTRWQVFITFLCITHTAFGQDHGCLGIEITEFLRSGDTKIRIGFPISQQWSAEAISSFHIYPPGKETGVSGPSVELFLRHWVRQCYDGIYLSFGICSGFRTETDMKFSFGYSLPIWKSIGMDIGYGFKVSETIKRKDLASGEISMVIHYIF